MKTAATGKLWKIGKWGGHPNYECLHCKYKTLEESRIRTHAKNAHPVEWRAALAAERVETLLEGLKFASDPARARARELSPEAAATLAKQKPSSANGYTVDDVTAVETATPAADATESEA